MLLHFVSTISCPKGQIAVSVRIIRVSLGTAQNGWNYEYQQTYQNLILDVELQQNTGKFLWSERA